MTDGAGRVVFRSGGAAETLGVEDPDSIAWMEHFLDAEGRRITDHLSFATAQVVWLRKPIPARGEDVARYDVALPGDLRGPLHLEARLLYRVALPELVFVSLRRDLPVPPFTLAELSLDLPEVHP